MRFTKVMGFMLSVFLLLSLCSCVQQTIVSPPTQETAQVILSGWQVMLNGKVFTVSEDMQYPLLLYNGTAYLPLTTWNQEDLGWKSVRVSQGIQIAVEEQPYIYSYFYTDCYQPQGSQIWEVGATVNITLVENAITIDDILVSASQPDAPPFLFYGTTLYLPLDAPFLEEALGFVCDYGISETGAELSGQEDYYFCLWRNAAYKTQACTDILATADRRVQQAEFFSFIITQESSFALTQNNPYIINNVICSISREHRPTGMIWWTTRDPDYEDFTAEDAIRTVHTLFADDNRYEFTSTEQVADKTTLPSPEELLFSAIPPADDDWLISDTEGRPVDFPLPSQQSMFMEDDLATYVIYTDNAWLMTFFSITHEGSLDNQQVVRENRMQIDLKTGRCTELRSGFTHYGEAYQTVFRFYYDLPFALSFASRSYRLEQLFSQAEEMLAGAEWLIVQQFVEYPVPKMGAYGLDRTFLYRRHLPSGTIWWTTPVGNHYLIKDGVSYSCYEEGTPADDGHGNLLNRIPLDPNAEPPSDELWLSQDEIPKPPVFIIDFNPLRNKTDDLHVSRYEDHLHINLSARSSPYPLYTANFAIDSSACLYYLTSVGETAWEHIQIYYDIEFTLPDP